VNFNLSMEAIIVIDNRTGSRPEQEEGIRANENIKARDVRLILADGKNVGVVSLKEALSQAREAGLDLVEVPSNSLPPVCKIINFGKYKYELQKRKSEAKKKQKVVEIKELKLTPTIDVHDYEVKIKAARKFLTAGNKVKFTLRFRGREMSYQNQGTDVFNRIKSDLADIGKVEQDSKLEGKCLGMMMGPGGTQS